MFQISKFLSFYFFMCSFLLSVTISSHPVGGRDLLSLILLYILWFDDLIFVCFEINHFLTCCLYTEIYISLMNSIFLSPNILGLYIIFHFSWKCFRLTFLHKKDVKQTSVVTEELFQNLDECKDHITECYICLETNKENPSLKVMSCGHPFHKECILEWFSVQKIYSPTDMICPVCRQSIFPFEEQV